MTLCLLQSADGVIPVSTTCLAWLLTSVWFHNNWHAKVTVSKGRCKVCQKKISGLFVRKSKRGCILETESPLFAILRLRHLFQQNILQASALITRGVFRWGRARAPGGGGAYPRSQKHFETCGRFASVSACTPTPQPAMHIAPVIREWAAVLVVLIQLFEIKLHGERPFSKSSGEERLKCHKDYGKSCTEASSWWLAPSFSILPSEGSREELRNGSRDLNFSIHHSCLGPSLRNHAVVIERWVDVQSTATWWTKLCGPGPRKPMTESGSLSMEENSRSVSFLFYISIHVRSSSRHLVLYIDIHWVYALKHNWASSVQIFVPGGFCCKRVKFAILAIEKVKNLRGSMPPAPDPARELALRAWVWHPATAATSPHWNLRRAPDTCLNVGQYHRAFP